MEIRPQDKRKGHPSQRRKNRAIGFLALMLGLLVFISACGSLFPQTVTVHPSWAQYYRLMKDLKQHSDFAVRGTISQIPAAVKSPDGYVYSMVTVSVGHVLWNSQHKTMPATIAVEQIGGEVENVTYVNPDDPLFKMNEQVILFLQEYQPGKFRITGGPSGRFTVTNGVVAPVVTDGVQLPGNTNETQFASDVQNS